MHPSPCGLRSGTIHLGFLQCVSDSRHPKDQDPQSDNLPASFRRWHEPRQAALQAGQRGRAAGESCRRQSSHKGISHRRTRRLARRRFCGMSEIVWLASYPKSGNTWLRVFLSNFLRPNAVPADINELEFGVGAHDRALFDSALGVESADLTEEEIECHRSEEHTSEL